MRISDWSSDGCSSDLILDSRAIRRTDCYAQRFMRPGRFSYAILPAHTAALSEDRPYTIIVNEGKKGGGEMAQHNVLIQAKGGRFQPEKIGRASCRERGCR